MSQPARPTMTPPRRVVIVGAGAIGASIGALLHGSGVTVVLVARGAHGDALLDCGLDLRTPAGAKLVSLPVVPTVAAAGISPTDLVILATMSQSGVQPVAGLDRKIVIASFQNGTGPLDALAAAGFPTIAAMVWVPAERRAPGQVVLAGAPHPGTILVGPWGAPQPRLGAWSDWLARRLTVAGFKGEAEPEIAPWIRAKVLVNLGGIVAALSDEPVDDVIAAAQAEALAVYAAAGQPTRSVAELLERVGPITAVAIDGQPRRGGSTRHALARIHAGEQGTLETGALHGPLITAGARLGVPTPINAALVRLAESAVAERWAPGALSADDLRLAVGLE